MYYKSHAEAYGKDFCFISSYDLKQTVNDQRKKINHIKPNDVLKIHQRITAKGIRQRNGCYLPTIKVSIILFKKDRAGASRRRHF